MKNLLAVIAALFFAVPAFAQQPAAQENAGAGEVLALKKEVAELKAKLAQIEKDYYDSLSEGMKRQNKLRAEIRRLKDELDEAKAAAAALPPAAAAAPAAIPPAAAPARPNETYDKGDEYRRAFERRMEREGGNPYPQPGAKPAEEKSESAGKGAKAEAAEKAEGGKKGFWDSAFPF